MKRNGCTFMFSFEKYNFISHSNTGEHRKNLLYFLIRLSSLFCSLIHALQHVAVDQKIRAKYKRFLISPQRKYFIRLLRRQFVVGVDGKKIRKRKYFYFIQWTNLLSLNRGNFQFFRNLVVKPRTIFPPILDYVMYLTVEIIK